MINEGRYKARGVEAALGFTGTGKEQVAILLEITEGEHAGDRITWYGFFTEKTTERTFESLRALGWSGDDLADLASTSANEVSIVVEHEEDNEGTPRARVRWINGGGGIAMRDTMDAGAAKAFAARMKGQAIASRQRAKPGAPPANGRSAPPSTQRTPAPAPRGAAAHDDAPPPGDDDIPF